MKKIAESLERLFQRYRLVFWYDEDGLMREIYEKLELEGVEKIELNGNPFGIKYHVLKVKPQKSFLIYSAHPRPTDEDNWLLDLELSHYRFEADRASLILQELGLDLVLKPIIERHIAFFRSGKRVEKLKKMLRQRNDEEELLLGMSAVVLGCGAMWDEVLFGLFATLGSDGKKLEDLRRFGLLEWVLAKAQRLYGYKCEHPSVRDLLLQLLLNHFYAKVDPKKMRLNLEAALFVGRWMDSSRNKETFASLSKEAEDLLGVEHILSSYSLQDLQESDTFEAIDKKVLSELKDLLLNKQNLQEIEQVIELRKRLFWYEVFEDLYEAIGHGAKMLSLCVLFVTNFFNAKDGFHAYVTRWYEIDYRYRKFVFHYKRANFRSLLESLLGQIEGAYMEYLRKIGDSWQEVAQKLEGWKIDGVVMQREFFEHYVAPNITQNRKVFVLISDALRYEAGIELAKRLVRRNRLSVEKEVMGASLPSYTQLGIASLLPHKRLSFDGKDGIVYVDGVRSDGSKNRDKILKMHYPKATYISAEEFMKMDKERGRTFVKDHQIVYIYHNEIDAVGDSAASESGVFDAVEKSFEEIEQIIKRVFAFNGNHVLITADHGFLYHEGSVDGTDQCSMPKGKVYKSARRFVIGKDLAFDQCGVEFDGEWLGIDDDVDVVMAQSINKFRLQGAGDRFVHGGMTLQEVAVPVIRCKRKREDDRCVVDVSVIKHFSRITSNQISLSLIQSQSVDEKCAPRVLKMAFYAQDGTLLSNIQKGIFDKKAEDLRNLEQKFSFVFNAKASEYNKQIVYFRMVEQIEDSSMERIYKEEPFEMMIAFSNDFEEF